MKDSLQKGRKTKYLINIGIAMLFLWGALQFFYPKTHSDSIAITESVEKKDTAEVLDSTLNLSEQDTLGYHEEQYSNENSSGLAVISEFIFLNILLIIGFGIVVYIVYRIIKKRVQHLTKDLSSVIRNVAEEKEFSDDGEKISGEEKESIGKVADFLDKFSKK